MNKQGKKKARLKANEGAIVDTITPTKKAKTINRERAEAMNRKLMSGANSLSPSQYVLNTKLY